MEEAGAQGRLGRTLGTFADPDRKHRTTVFVLHVDTENGGLVDDFEEKVSMESCNLNCFLHAKFHLKCDILLSGSYSMNDCTNYRIIVSEDGFPSTKQNTY